MENVTIPWPDWEAVRKIGSGSFGSVYEIERKDRYGHAEKSALKVISIPKEDNEIDTFFASGYDEKTLTLEYDRKLEKVINEYVLMSELKAHPNIVKVEDRKAVRQENGIGWHVYIRMELLKSLLKELRKKEMSEADILKLGKDLCSALSACHEKNIIHRDIKPQNIFVTEYGDYKLGDFGVARTMMHTTNATMTGTLNYIAPEVYKNEKYGREADIYSLGLVMYWLLNDGKMPFEPENKLSRAEDIEKALVKRMKGTEPIPEPKRGSTALKKAVLKALSYNPADRYHSAADMLADMEGSTLQKEPVHAEEPTEPPVKPIEEPGSYIFFSPAEDIDAPVSEDKDDPYVRTYSKTMGAEWSESEPDCPRTDDVLPPAAEIRIESDVSSESGAETPSSDNPGGFQNLKLIPDKKDDSAPLIKDLGISCRDDQIIMLAEGFMKIYEPPRALPMMIVTPEMTKSVISVYSPVNGKLSLSVGLDEYLYTIEMNNGASVLITYHANIGNAREKVEVYRKNDYVKAGELLFTIKTPEDAYWRDELTMTLINSSRFGVTFAPYMTRLLSAGWNIAKVYQLPEEKKEDIENAVAEVSSADKKNNIVLFVILGLAVLFIAFLIWYAYSGGQIQSS